MGRNTSHVTKMEYNTIAQTEPDIANLMAKYVEDSFQPLNEPDFEYQYFEQITQEWNDVQNTLINIQPSTLGSNHILLDHSYHNAFTTTTPSPMLKDTNISEISALEDVPNPTKHQQKMYNILNFQLCIQKQKRTATTSLQS